MKQVHFYPNKSSFLSMEKDTALIVNKMLKNDELKKLLYYPIKEYHSMPNLTQEQTLSLINDQIKIVPNLKIDNEVKSYVFITFDNFVENAVNPEFRDNTITFDIMCHYDIWNLGDFKLRPYRIAGELDSMFNNAHLTGIGELYFSGANYIALENHGVLSLTYIAIHGEEDKVV